MSFNQWTKQALVKAIMQDVPEPNYKKMTEDCQAVVVKAMTPAVRKVYRENPKALNSEYVNLQRNSFTLVVGDVKHQDLIEPVLAPQRQRDKVWSDLRNLVNGCKSEAQFRKLCPELAHYLPRAEKGLENLPIAAGTIAEMVKLGWTGPQIEGQK